MASSPYARRNRRRGSFQGHFYRRDESNDRERNQERRDYVNRDEEENDLWEVKSDEIEYKDIQEEQHSNDKGYRSIKREREYISMNDADGQHEVHHRKPRVSVGETAHTDSRKGIGKNMEHREGFHRNLDEEHSRRSRPHEREFPAKISMLDLKEEPPLPPPPGRHFGTDRNNVEYGQDDYEEGDPRLRAELYPLEENLYKENLEEQEAENIHRKRSGSRINVVSAENFGRSPHSRQVDHSYSHQSRLKQKSLPESSGSKKFSSRSVPHVQGHMSGNFEERNSHDERKEYYGMDEGKRSDSLRRRSLGESRILHGSVKGSQGYSILKEEEDNIERNASVLLPVLEDTEKIFHELVASGDVNATRVFLQRNPNFNINCVNYQKISALHVAVKQQNEAMVEFLLEQKHLDISDCALYAIKGGSITIVEMILDKIYAKSPSLEFAGATHSVDFPDDLTPLILAAQLGNYEMIDFLIKRGHSIPSVHPPFCKCEICRAALKKYDRLRYSTMKLNLYEAICNPMYIFHTTDDPFQRAFELTKELQDAATVFPQFKVSFEKLWVNLRTFTADLIGCCRNAPEVEIVLKKSPKSVGDHLKFPRLQYAIDLKQKEFVSHPYTQAVLGDAWTGELLEWKIRSPLMQSLAVFPRIPMLPVMTVMCIFLPNHRLVKRWKTPVNKMISSVASYLIFLIILFLESNLDKSNQKRGPPNSGLEGVIIIYVIGYIWLNVRTCFKQGLTRFFSIMWHWYDTIMLLLFAMTIIFWIASLVDITANDDIDLPRKYWNSLDPELIAEGLFAAAVVMAFFRLNLFLSLNYHLGPLQVSIGKMTLDIFKFIIIFFVIILAWCAGLCRFYQPYEGMVQKDAVSGSTTTQVSSFVNFAMTLKTFFWAIFGMSPIESADVIIENLPGDTPDTTIINKHQFTEAVGYIAFALYQFLSAVVVLNMLVACMANTFTKVIDNVTVEWVFGRSQIYLSFMASSVLPPPFNLIPTASGVKDMCKWFRLLAKPGDGQKAKCNLAHCCYIEHETEPYVNSEFPSLMSELAQRYIRLKTQEEEEQQNHEIDELRNDVLEIKELLNRVNSGTVKGRSVNRARPDSYQKSTEFI